MPFGIYIHVPFCRSRCIYCDFYSTTLGASIKEKYVRALVKELQYRAGEADNGEVATIYVGGGTPSQLSLANLEQIFSAIYNNYNVQEGAEVTLECNPDDVTSELCRQMRGWGVNRVSLGVQSFDEAQLRKLRRRHTARQAVSAVETIRQYTTENITIDLIYGLPDQTEEAWRNELCRALALPIRHLSAYSLTYEPDTPLWKMREQGEVKEADETLSLKMYSVLMEEMEAAGFEHYEISNFARPGYRSRHNSSYWQGIPYLGFGPAPHSYDGKFRRRYNLSNITSYISDKQKELFKVEVLTERERYDELVMTHLRMRDGLPLNLLLEANRQYFLQQAQPHIRRGMMSLADGIARLTREGLFVSDDILSDLMLP